MKDRYELDRCEAMAEALLRYERDVLHLAKDTESFLKNLGEFSRHMDISSYEKYASMIMNSLHQMSEIANEAEETAGMIKRKMWDHIPTGTEPLRPPWD